MVQGVIVEDGHIVNTNPATGEVIGKVPVTSPEDLEATIARAKEAQLGWSLTPLEERVRVLKSAAAKLAEDKEGLACLITQEMGKVIAEAMEEAEFSTDKVAVLDRIQEANLPVHYGSADETPCTVIRDAHGVVGLCTPWNFPADEIMNLALPALAAGNTVVVKPSEVTPLTGAKVLQALQAVLPSGCAGLVQGDGTVGELLVKHRDIAMVAMTGSSATGKLIMQACAASLKPLILELGGKDPMVVFADADLDLAAEDAVANSLMNCGQVCCAVERVYIQEEVKAAFEEKVVAKARAWKAGNGMDEGAKLGPMVSSLQFDFVTKQVEEAVSSGARILYQENLDTEKDTKRPRLQGLEGKRCPFFPATVLTDLRQDMRIQREETFGPVVALSAFSGAVEEAVRLANDTQYGLTACVYTKDLAKGARVAGAIRAGQVGINSIPMNTAALGCPFGGHKGSGFGCHSGPDGWRQFSVPKSIVGMSK